jgi:type II secretory pathway pseudopilin PulG
VPVQAVINPVSRLGRNAGRARAFTIVELAVVIAVIGLVLAIAVPGLRKMSEDARYAAAYQTLNGNLQRAHANALADQNLTAVRLVPGHWDVDEDGQSHGGGEHQHLVHYRYVGATTREQPPGSGQFVTEYGERFERREGIDSVELPNDMWAAPIEAWRARDPANPGSQANNDPADPNNNHNPLHTKLLEGNLEAFALDPLEAGEQMLEADDFLVVFDPQTGVRAGRSKFQLLAYDPSVQRERVDDETGASPASRVKFMRSSSEGAVIYRREPFVALGDAANGSDRQNALRQSGRPYFVHRLSGALVTGTQEE